MVSIYYIAICIQIFVFLVIIKYPDAYFVLSIKRCWETYVGCRYKDNYIILYNFKNKIKKRTYITYFL